MDDWTMTRVVNGRRASDTEGLDRTCPVCGAAKGWRCTKTVGYQVLPRKAAHPERKGRK